MGADFETGFLLHLAAVPVLAPPPRAAPGERSPAAAFSPCHLKIGLCFLVLTLEQTDLEKEAQC